MRRGDNMNYDKYISIITAVFMILAVAGTIVMAALFIGLL